MIPLTPTISIPETEITWKFARSSGPGGQNVNKVASKALLVWDIARTSAIADEVKIRLALHHKRFFNAEGQFFITSQKYRDQDRNRQDCLERLGQLIVDAQQVPKARKATRPSRGSKRARLQDKKRRSQIKQGRKMQGED